MPYSVQFTVRALRDFKALDRPIRPRLRNPIDRLAQNPFAPGAKKLHGEEPYYRIRVGDHRVIHQVETGQMRVVVVKIGHRREVYR